MKKTIYLLCLFICFNFSFSARHLYGKNRIEIGVRLYEGFRENIFNHSQVISSYNIGTLTNYCDTLKKGISLEKNGLKKVFNLKSIRIISFGYLLIADKKSNISSMSLIGLKTSLYVSVQLLNRYKSLFKISVKKQKSSPASLLETELVIPDKRRTAFGFEGKNNRIYYIVFSREKKLLHTENAMGQQNITLREKIVPSYPQPALNNRIEGIVCFEAYIDKTGEVKEIKTLKGEEMLIKSALTSLNQWRYVINQPQNIKQKIKISVAFLYELADSVKSKNVELKYTNFRINYLTKNKISDELKNNIYNIRPINFQKPVYPAEAGKQNKEGYAKFRISVNRNGKIITTQVLGGDPVFIKAGEESIKKWSFVPYLENGSRFKFTFDVQFVFSISYK